jgi:nitrous oxidase accessory protein NosD
MLYLAIDCVSALLTKQPVARLLLGSALFSVLVDAMRCFYAIVHAHTALILLLYRVVTTSTSYL